MPLKKEYSSGSWAGDTAGNADMTARAESIMTARTDIFMSPPVYMSEITEIKTEICFILRSHPEINRISYLKYNG
jgi:hypothetical protein